MARKLTVNFNEMMMMIIQLCAIQLLKSPFVIMISNDNRCDVLQTKANHIMKMVHSSPLPMVSVLAHCIGTSCLAHALIEAVPIVISHLIEPKSCKSTKKFGTKSLIPCA